jgi:hypothetical protein
MNLYLAATSVDVRAWTPRGVVARPGWLPPLRQAPDTRHIAIVPVPLKCPELNAREHLWRFVRNNWLSNRVFDSTDTFLDHCRDAWSKLEAQPWTIMSIGLRDWAYAFRSLSPGIKRGHRLPKLSAALAACLAYGVLTRGPASAARQPTSARGPGREVSDVWATRFRFHPLPAARDCMQRVSLSMHGMRLGCLISGSFSLDRL